MDMKLLIARFLYNKTKTAVALGIIAFSVLPFLVVKTAMVSYIKKIEKPFRDTGIHCVIQKSSATGKTNMGGMVQLPFSQELFTEKELHSIANHHNIHQIAQALLVWVQWKGKFTTILGIDPLSDTIGAVKVIKWVSNGTFPTSPHEIALEKHFAKFHGLKVGSSFIISDREVTVSGIITIKEGNSLISSNGYMLKHTVHSLLDIQNPVNILYASLKDQSGLKSMRDDFTGMKNIHVQSSDSFLEAAGGMITLFKNFSSALTILTLAIMMLLITKVLYGIYLERVHDTGVLKAIGWNRKEIAVELIKELVILTLIGTSIGIVISNGISFFISTIPFSLSRGELAPPSTAVSLTQENPVTFMPFLILPESILLVCALVLILSLSCGYWFSLRIQHIKPADLLRNVV